MIVAPSLPNIFRVMQKKNYTIFNNSRGYDLNIVGIRSDNMKANTFNDFITVFYIFENMWQYFSFPVTTDPGLYYRENPMNVEGTAIVVPDQYRGLWELGEHKGNEALVQKEEICVYRDNNIDNVLNNNVVVKEGMFGINCHLANKKSRTTVVDKWSAGCQVFQDPVHFKFFLTLCNYSSKLFGNSFSYTLLTESDFKR